MDANQTSPAYELKDELARLCLPAANRDANQKLAWVNSVCILFLIVGIFGARGTAGLAAQMAVGLAAGMLFAQLTRPHKS